MKTIIIIIGIFLLSNLTINSQVVLEVTKTTDPDPYVYHYNVVDSLCAPEMYGTVQWASRKANDLGVPCRIIFNIPGTGLKVINLNYQLPIINVPIEIDGTTQPGYAYPNPQILLKNNSTSSVLVGLHIHSGNGSKIKGIAFMKFWYAAIRVTNCTNYELKDNVILENSNIMSKSSVAVIIANSSNGIIQGNYVGLTPDGTAYSNVGVGILLTEMSSNSTIGGTASGQANTIANNYTGIQVNTGTGNNISGNKIFNNPYAILLTNDGNLKKTAPSITTYNGTTVFGTSDPNDIIEIFGSTGNENANEYLATVTADGNGDWTANVSTTFTGLVATATDLSDNTSAVSEIKQAFICYSINATEKAFIISPEVQTSILATCSEYILEYKIQFNVTPILHPTFSTTVTINLPSGLSYHDIAPNSSSNISLLSGADPANPVFTFSGLSSFPPIGGYTLRIFVFTPSCDIETTHSNTTTITAMPCQTTPYLVYSSLQIVKPELFVQNTYSGPLLVNTGDAGELVFRIANNSLIADIPIIHVNLNPENSIVLDNSYYLTDFSNSNPTSSVLFAGNQITLDDSDFNNVFSNNFDKMPPGGVFYLHVPYSVPPQSICQSDNGEYVFTNMCGTEVCSSVNITSQIIVINNGMPDIVISDYIVSHADYCSSSGPLPPVEMGFTYRNDGIDVTGTNVPPGNAKAIDLEVYIYNDISVGVITDNNFIVSFGSNEISLAVQQLSNQTVSGITYAVYKLDFSNNFLSGGNQTPLGAGSISDIDGDGYVDDLDISNEFSVKVQYQYNTDCSTSNLFTGTCTSGADVLYTQIRYDSQCHLPSDYPGQQTFSATNFPSGVIGYSNVIDPIAWTYPEIPFDVTETPFNLGINLNRFYERWTPQGYGFDCNNGTHQLKLILPYGYHLNRSLLTETQPGSNEYYLSDIIVRSECNLNTTQTLQPKITETDPVVDLNPLNCIEQGYLTIDFGLIDYLFCNNANRTFLFIDDNFNPITFSIPMLFDCSAELSGNECVEYSGSTTDPAGNIIPVADVFTYQFYHICDNDVCPDCKTRILCNSGQVGQHHCPGLCNGNPFHVNGPSVDPFIFDRQNIGFINHPTVNNSTDLYYDCIVVSSAASSSPDKSCAYPGDLIKMHVSGIYAGKLNDYNDIRLQLSYPEITSAVPDIFELAPNYISQIVITSSVASTETIVLQSSDVTFGVNSASQIVNMYFSFQSAFNVFDPNETATYEFIADIFLIAKTQPAYSPPSVNTFYPQGTYLINPRIDFVGIDATGAIAGHVCDTWQAPFRIYQPSAGTYVSVGGSSHTSACEIMNADFCLQVRLQDTHYDDFPEEFKPYASLGSDITITIPEGYTYITNSSSFHIYANQNSGSGNGFGSHYEVSFPINPISVSTVSGITTLVFSAADLGGCWPLLDVNYCGNYEPIYFIRIQVQPECNAPSGVFNFYGVLNESISTENTAYIVSTPFNTNSYNINHIEPDLLFAPPTSQICVTTNNLTFDFQVCTGNISSTSAWLTFENTTNFSVDLASAAIVDVMNNVYTPTLIDINGNAGILFNIGVIASPLCHDFTFSAPLLAPGGCVPQNSVLYDNISVNYGNSCSQDISGISNYSQLSCYQGSANVNFIVFPSNLEILTPSGLPVTLVDLCNGTDVNYQFVINSNQTGTVLSPVFWVKLPSGVSVVGDVEFIYPAPSSNTFFFANSLSDPIWGTGWDLSQIPDIGLNGLPGSSTPESQIHVSITLHFDCPYNAADFVNFFASWTPNCNATTMATQPVSHRPDVTGLPANDNLNVSYNFTTSDASPGLTCSNHGTITLTVTNSGQTTQHDNVLSIDLQSLPFIITNPDPLVATNGSLVEWTLPVLTNNESQTFSFDITFSSNDCPPEGYNIQPDLLYRETIDCSPAPDCPMSYYYDIQEVHIDACCECFVSATSTDILCFGESTGSVAAFPSTSNPSYLWQNEQSVIVGNTSSVTGLPAGIYTVIVIDNGCIATATVAINEPEQLIVDFITTNASCATNSDGSATAIPQGGIAPYDFSWVNPPINSDNIDGVPAGNYTVIVTDANDCTVELNVDIEADPFPDPEIVVSNNNPSCHDNIIIEFPTQFTVDQQSGTIYNWTIYDFYNSNNIYNDYTSTGTSVLETFPDIGYYNVCVQATNGCGTDYDNVIVYVSTEQCSCPDAYEFNDIPIEYDQSMTGTHTVYGDIIINEGMTLTLSNCTLQFSPRGHIIVQREATLEIDNSTLTSFSYDCGMWQGIEVWGDATLPSSSAIQGRVVISNNSIISDAHIGVLLGRRNMPDDCHPINTQPIFNYAYSGGIIYTPNSNAQFNNNGIHIYFVPKTQSKDCYANWIGSCYFNCDGINDKRYDITNSVVYPNPHNPWAGYANHNWRTDVGIVVSNAKLLRIVNNHFNNSEYGILGFNNQINYYSGNKFRNHRYGILVATVFSTVSSRYLIRYNEFDFIPGNTLGALSTYDGTALGIYAGIGDYIYDWNQFLNDPQNTISKGIVLFRSGSFNVLNNHYKGLNIGTTICNSGNLGGFVRASETTTLPSYSWFGNIYINCKAGIKSYGGNPNLIFRCNEHTTSFASAMNLINNNTTLANQGFAPISSQQTGGLFCYYNLRRPAGNLFQGNRSISSDFTYTYFHHSNNDAIPTPDPTNCVNLQEITCFHPADKSLYCPFPDLNPPQTLGSIQNDPAVIRFDSLTNAVSALKQQYDNIVNNADKGKTTILLNVIYANPTSLQLKNLLINNSPLSDTVLIALNIQNPLSPGNYKNVMEENLPVTRKVLPSFLSRVETLPDGIKKQLKEKQAYNPEKITPGYIERQLEETGVLRQYYFNAITNLLLDTVNQRTADAISMFEKEGSDESRIVVAATYLSENNIAIASQKIAALPESTTELSDWKIYATILLNNMSQGKTIEELDNNQIDVIRTLAYRCPENLATVNAISLLLYLFREEVRPCPEATYLSMKYEKSTKETVVSYLGENYPDPFTGKTVIPYYLPDNCKGEMVIRDVAGREIKRYDLMEGDNELNIDSHSWKSGIYFYGMLINNEQFCTKKMIKTE